MDYHGVWFCYGIDGGVTISSIRCLGVWTTGGLSVSLWGARREYWALTWCGVFLYEYRCIRFRILLLQAFDKVSSVFS